MVSFSALPFYVVVVVSVMLTESEIKKPLAENKKFKTQAC
jgi:hypothetical protein